LHEKGRRPSFLLQHPHLFLFFFMSLLVGEEKDSLIVLGRGGISTLSILDGTLKADNLSDQFLVW
jgi:hypothetical protein